MNTLSKPMQALVLSALAAIAGSANAETAAEHALSAGASKLSSDEIATRFVGKTVTFETGEKTFLVHYGANNVVSGKLVGKAWADTGYYGVTNDDRVCLSWSKSDKGRLRCWTVLVVDDVIEKFNPDGSLDGMLPRIQDGKTF